MRAPDRAAELTTLGIPLDLAEQKSRVQHSVLQSGSGVCSLTHLDVGRNNIVSTDTHRRADARPRLLHHSDRARYRPAGETRQYDDARWVSCARRPQSVVMRR